MVYLLNEWNNGCIEWLVFTQGCGKNKVNTFSLCVIVLPCVCLDLVLRRIAVLTSHKGDACIVWRWQGCTCWIAAIQVLSRRSGWEMVWALSAFVKKIIKKLIKIKENNRRGNTEEEEQGSLCFILASWRKDVHGGLAFSVSAIWIPWLSLIHQVHVNGWSQFTNESSDLQHLCTALWVVLPCNHRFAHILSLWGVVTLCTCQHMDEPWRNAHTANWWGTVFSCKARFSLPFFCKEKR